MYKFMIALGLVISSLTVNAATVQCFKTSQDLIKDLYQKYPIKGGHESIANQKRVILERYFSKNLVNLLLQDQRCAAKIQGECNIGFDILSNAQDEPDNGQIKILQATANVVTVKIDFQQSPEFIDFKMQQQSGCFLINDIQYEEHRSLEKILRYK